MKKYIVTIALVIGYDPENAEPKLTYAEYQVFADTEAEARERAKEQDKTFYSVWESWAEEIPE